MGFEIRNDVSAMTYRPDSSNYETPKVSNNSDNRVDVAEGNKNVTNTNGLNKTNAVTASDNVNNTRDISSVYESQQQRKSLEIDLNEIIQQIMPERGIKFRVHEDTGAIITSVIDKNSDKVVREFPAEKILDMVHSMAGKIGTVVNKKV